MAADTPDTLDTSLSFRAMVEKVRDYAIFLMDAHGVIQTWNAAAVAMKRYSAEEVIGSFFGVLYTEEDRKAGKPEHNLKMAREHGTFQEESWRQRKDGTLFWALVEIIALPGSGFCKITRDLSDRKALIEQLERERERAQVTLGAISDGVLSYDAAGHVDFLNERAEELTGWRAIEAKGRLLAEVLDLRASGPEGSEASSVGPAPGPPAMSVLVSRSGARREVEHASAVIRLPDGSSAGGVIVLRDTSHLRFVEKELKHADRRKDEFLAMLAHELRNPLAPISAAADLLAMVKADPERVQRTSEVIRRQVRHMTSLIEDLLDVSRVTRGLVVLEQAQVDLKDVITDALEQVRPLIESRSHRLSVDLAPQEALVLGDRKRLVQVVANLLGNAAKYTLPGGHVSVGLQPQDGHVELWVQDDGIGMSAELVQRAFQMFTQGERTPDRAQGGLGIGLALVRSLVNLHQGSVRAESAGPGKGSRFTVVLPRVQPAESSPAGGGEASAADAPPAQVRVLVVDDNHDAAELLAEFLRAFGHEVAVEHHSRGALSRAAAFTPDVCLLDIGLPDMDGLQLARRLRQTLPDAVLVAVTGYGQPQDVRNALAAGFDHHFVKPVDQDRLLRLLEEVAHGAAVRQGG